MGRVEKVMIGAVVALYAGLLTLLVAYGHGPAAVLAFLCILVKAALYFGFMRHAATMGTGARRQSITATTLLQGRST